MKLRRYIALFALTGAALVGPPAHAQGKFSADRMVTVAPAPDAPVIGPVKPTWCDEIGANYGPGALGRMTSNKDVLYDLNQGAGATCSDPDNPLFQQQVGHFFQRLANETGADLPVLTRLISLYADPDKIRRQRDEGCDKLPELRDGSPRDREVRRYERAVIGCGVGSPLALDHINVGEPVSLWAIDRTEAYPSQLAGIGYLVGCLSTGLDDTSDPALIAWAKCRVEANLIDPTQLAKEASQLGLNDYGRVMADMALAYIRYVGVRREAALLKRAAKDADVKAVWLDAPAQAWKEWKAQYAANKAAVDAANAYEDKYYGPSKRAATGCLAQVEGITKLVRGAGAPKDPQALAQRAASGLGGVLLTHLYRCLVAEGHTAPAAGVAELLSLGMPARGPRTAVLFAMSKAAAAIAEDRRSTRIVEGIFATDYRTPDDMLSYGQQRYRGADHFGVVKSVKVEGDRVVVTFQTVRWKEKEQVCTITNRLIQWRPDGTPIYAEDCHYTGRMVERSDTAYSFWTSKALASGIKPKTFVRYSTGANFDNKVFDGYPVEVWTDKNQKKLVAVLGVPVP